MRASLASWACCSTATEAFTNLKVCFFLKKAWVFRENPVKETDPLVQKMAGLDGRDIRAWLVQREDGVPIEERERELWFSFEGRDDFVVWLNCDVLGLGRGRLSPLLDCQLTDLAWNWIGYWGYMLLSGSLRCGVPPCIMAPFCHTKNWLGLLVNFNIIDSF